jgi:hypothetical protein
MLWFYFSPGEVSGRGPVWLPAAVHLLFAVGWIIVRSGFFPKVVYTDQSAFSIPLKLLVLAVRRELAIF